MWIKAILQVGDSSENEQVTNRKAEQIITIVVDKIIHRFCVICYLKRAPKSKKTDDITRENEMQKKIMENFSLLFTMRQLRQRKRAMRTGKIGKKA